MKLTIPARGGERKIRNELTSDEKKQ